MKGLKTISPLYGLFASTQKKSAPAPAPTPSMPNPDDMANAKRRKANEMLTAKGTINATRLTPERKIARNGENLTAVGYSTKLG